MQPFEMKNVAREIPTLHDRCLVMFVFNTCVWFYKMFARFFCEQILSIKNHKNRSISAGGRAKRDRAPCQPVGTFQRGGVVDKKRWRMRSDTPLPLRFYMEIITKMRLEKGKSV